MRLLRFSKMCGNPGYGQKQRNVKRTHLKIFLAGRLHYLTPMAYIDSIQAQKLHFKLKQQTVFKCLEVTYCTNPTAFPLGQDMETYFMYASGNRKTIYE